MCERCDKNVIVKPWKAWVGIALTFIIFIGSQVFLYGQVTQSISDHIKNDPTHKEMVEEFVTQREFQMLVKSMDDKLKTITDFIKEGK